MRGFGSLRIASVLAILFVSLAACMPSEKFEHPEDAPDDEDLGNDPDEDENTEIAKPVTVRSWPTTVNARLGETVQLPCLVDNAEDTTINWIQDKKPYFVNASPVTDTKGRIIRADNFSLIIQNVTEEDASDLWHCQICSQTPPTELYHKLRIVQKPRELSTGIRVFPDRKVEVDENDSITLGCETSSEPKREIKWSYKGERLHNDDDYEIDGNFVKIKKINLHHAGRYQCLVEDNSESPMTDAIEVFLRYAPRIDVERQVVHTGAGRRAELTCTVHAHPHASVTWHKDNRKSIVDSGEKFKTIDNKSRRTLVIRHITKDDLGQYTCKAKNKLGETSRVIELTGAPSRPRLHGGEVSDDEPTLILKWHVESFAPIVEYKLEYRQKDEKEWKTASPRVTDGDGNQFNVEYPLEKLQPGSYEAKLMARNDYGWSQHSDIHTFKQGYKSERVENVKGSAVTYQPLLALTALLVIAVTSYKSSCL